MIKKLCFPFRSSQEAENCVINIHLGNGSTTGFVGECAANNTAVTTTPHPYFL